MYWPKVEPSGRPRALSSPSRLYVRLVAMIRPELGIRIMAPEPSTPKSAKSTSPRRRLRPGVTLNSTSSGEELSTPLSSSRTRKTASSSPRLCTSRSERQLVPCAPATWAVALMINESPGEATADFRASGEEQDPLSIASSPATRRADFKEKQDRQTIRVSHCPVRFFIVIIAGAKALEVTI